MTWSCVVWRKAGTFLCHYLAACLFMDCRYTPRLVILLLRLKCMSSRFYVCLFTVGYLIMPYKSYPVYVDILLFFISIIIGTLTAQKLCRKSFYVLYLAVLKNTKKPLLLIVEGRNWQYRRSSTVNLHTCQNYFYQMNLVWLQAFQVLVFFFSWVLRGSWCDTAQPEFNLEDLPLFVVTSAAAGVLGALLNTAHGWLSQFRPPSRQRLLRFAYI